MRDVTNDSHLLLLPLPLPLPLPLLLLLLLLLLCRLFTDERLLCLCAALQMRRRFARG